MLSWGTDFSTRRKSLANRENAMNLLALDTATAACSAAVLRGGDLAAHGFETMQRGHAEALMPMIEALMAEAALAYEDLDLVAVTVGPGTFTGVRVGLATARGLALAAGVPAFGANTLEVLAEDVAPAARAGRSLAVALDARRGELYVQAFDAALDPLGPPAVLDAAAAADGLPDGPLLLAGDGAPALAAALGARPGVEVAEEPRLPDAAGLARLAARRMAAGPLPAHPPRPLYIRSHGARLPGAVAGP